MDYRKLFRHVKFQSARRLADNGLVRNAGSPGILFQACWKKTKTKHAAAEKLQNLTHFLG